MANSVTAERMLIGGEWVAGPESLEVRNPFDGGLVGTIASGTTQNATAAVTAAVAALRQPLPAHQRYQVLQRTADRIEARQDEYAWTIASEGSKTIREARSEPPRAATILRLAAEAGRQLSGETLPFDSRQGSENRVGYYSRLPVGVIAAITPFNDPLAMVAHKIGPALAAGNAVVLKPASSTPLSALMVARDLAESGLPPGRLNVVTGSGQAVGETLVMDRRVRLVSFTGGVATGERITRVAGIKKLSLELGSNSPVIVMPDARLDRAVAAIASGAFAQAGQNCLGVQRVLIHERVYEQFVARFVPLVAALRAGRSTDERTDVCAMIDEAQASRVEGWIGEALSHGAHLLTGGHRTGALLTPAVVVDIPDGVHLACDEAYGPVVGLYRVASLDEAIARANAVDYGLHAAIFTENLHQAFAAAARLEVGAVIVNDSTDYRLDLMPFGGTKLSGLGREGIKFALHEMTEPRVVCFNLDEAPAP
ncbi:MAG: aldehyde dehydrogenase family protein [Vicinamibacterales bacterium]